MDLKNQMAGYKIFAKLDDEVTAMNKLIDSKVEIKSIQDLERVASIIEKAFKNILTIIDSTEEFDPVGSKVIRNASILDFHIRLAEERKVELYQLLNMLGSFHLNAFEKAKSNSPFK